MRHLSSPLPRPLAAALLCAALWPAVWASEHADTPQPKAAATLAKADTAAASATAAATPASGAKAERPGAKPPMRSSAKPVEPTDPMDRLRERLAEKLGATRTSESPNPAVLRVATSLNAGHGGAPAESAARASAARAKAPAGDAGHWDYQGSGGPEHWGGLKPEFAKCSSGTRQSPIDIRDGIAVQLDPVQFDYKPSGFRVLDNGHTIQVNVAAGNTIEVMGRRFELLQFHFHRPSEERVDGRQFDMVAHLVHKDLEGKLAVVAVLLERGSAQPLIQTVWNNLPLEKGDEVAAKGTLDLNALLPPERNYFTYMGSLTTPPCSEGVLWMVMKQPVPLSADQIGIFARLYPMNARPVQSASGRLIKQSN